MGTQFLLPAVASTEDMSWGQERRIGGDNLEVWSVTGAVAG